MTSAIAPLYHCCCSGSHFGLSQLLLWQQVLLVHKRMAQGTPQTGKYVADCMCCFDAQQTLHTAHSKTSGYYQPAMS
jgi:hypothetical protein